MKTASADYGEHQSRQDVHPSPSGHLERVLVAGCRDHHFVGGKREYSNEEAQYALVTSSAPTANDAPIGDNCPVARSVACVLMVILSPISANKSSMPPSGLSRVTAYASIVDRVVRGSRCRSGQRHALPNVSTHTQMPAAS